MLDNKEETKFQVGDVVCLKSGGPSMTIGNIDGDYAECYWFNVLRDIGFSNDVHYGRLNLKCLVKS